jgi:hypothetical protein
LTCQAMKKTTKTNLTITISSSPKKSLGEVLVALWPNLRLRTMSLGQNFRSLWKTYKTNKTSWKDSTHFQVRARSSFNNNSIKWKSKTPNWNPNYLDYSQAAVQKIQSWWDCNQECNCKNLKRNCNTRQNLKGNCWLISHNLRQGIRLYRRMLLSRSNRLRIFWMLFISLEMKGWLKMLMRSCVDFLGEKWMIIVMFQVLCFV